MKNLKIDKFDFSNVNDMSFMFNGCKNIITTIKINAADGVKYENIFNNAATTDGAEIQVFYTEELEKAGIIDEMLATGTGNLIKKGAI